MVHMNETLSVRITWTHVTRVVFMLLVQQSSLPAMFAYLVSSARLVLFCPELPCA